MFAGKHYVMTINYLYLSHVGEAVYNMLSNIISRRIPFLAIIAFQVVLGCDASSQAERVEISTVAVTEMTVPTILRTVEAVNPDALVLSTTVNGVDQEMVRDVSDNVWRGVVEVPPNRHSDVEIEWGMQYTDRNGSETILDLAKQRNRFVFVDSEERSIEFFEDEYETDFHADGDGLNNLLEVTQRRSPTDVLDVFIDENGSFATFGNGLGPSGICGHKIPISVVTVKPDGAETPLVENPSWWCARLKSELIDADGNVVPVRNLEVMVNVYDDPPIIDSRTDEFFADFQDDSVEIYIDGNNTKGFNYDGVNDYQFVFAPFGDGVARLARGPGTMPENLSGTFTLNDDGYQLVATIPLPQVNIVSNRAFGFNVEINDDDDGDTRDYKYSWIGTEGRDFSFFRPSVFGTSQVP